MLGAVAAAAAIVALPPTARAHHAHEHWTSPLVVIRDETGVPEYRRAIALAAARWNAAGAPVRLDVQDGLGRGCDSPPVGEISVCRHDLPASTVGEARSWLDGDHIVKASVLMDTAPRPFEHLVAIACHELGHTLGMDHRTERSSCLTATIHSSDPDQHDHAELRRTHGHQHDPAPPPEAPERCSGLVRLGGVCLGSLEQVVHRH